MNTTNTFDAQKATRHIALLIDIDNVDISLDTFSDIMSTLENYGVVEYVKLYGFNERRHVNWDEMIARKGYDTCSTMRFRKRNKSQIDLRLVVDAMRLNFTQPNIDSFCIIAGQGDLVPLLTALKLEGHCLMDFVGIGYDLNKDLFNVHLEFDTKSDPQKQARKHYTAKLQELSEKTAAMALEDTVDKKIKTELINEVEIALKEMEVQQLGEDLMKGYRNILEIIDAF